MARLLSKLGFKVRFTGFRVVNMLAAGIFPFAVRVIKLAKERPKVSTVGLNGQESGRKYWATRSHRSLIRLPHPARSVRALHCTHSLARLLPSSWGKCINSMSQNDQVLPHSALEARDKRDTLALQSVYYDSFFLPTLLVRRWITSRKFIQERLSVSRI